MVRQELLRMHRLNRSLGDVGLGSSEYMPSVLPAVLFADFSVEVQAG